VVYSLMALEDYDIGALGWLVATSYAAFE
jgi:hypothetical protein